jgi:hypothetical protein
MGLDAGESTLTFYHQRSLPWRIETNKIHHKTIAVKKLAASSLSALGQNRTSLGKFNSGARGRRRSQVRLNITQAATLVGIKYGTGVEIGSKFWWRPLHGGPDPFQKPG